MSNRNRMTGFAAVLLASAIFPAAADDGKPRYVSGSGRDQGDCQNRFRPCRNLSYAIARSGKGDSIQVAEGTYTVKDSAQLLDVLSVSGRIAGGFSQYSSYSERNATPGTVLVGIPAEFRERFETAGFTVIADTKGLEVSGEQKQSMRKLTAQFAAAEQSHAATPCVSNISAGFACQSVSLHSHLSLQDLTPAGSSGADVWGFTDLNTGREYAFMGLRTGVAVVDITNPDVPEQVDSESGSSTTWREIKVHQVYDASAARWRAYAYVTADNISDFMMILDLSGLPNGMERVTTTLDYRAAHNVSLVNSDYTYGIAQTADGPQLAISGANANNGNYRLYSLQNPVSPQLLKVSTAGYAHDLASFPITDARKNTQCFNAASRPFCQVLSDFNENTLDLWDVTDPSAAQLLVSQPYTNASYVHSGWWTEDGRYLLVHDELDEQNFGLNTTVRVFDVANLRAPALAGSWVGPTRAIDHNGYVRGNRYYMSNYSEGLTVLDISDPRTPSRVGYFDTYPASAQTSFVGAWGVYPFFASGTIIIGDINTGLYVLKNETLGTANGSFAMANATLAGTEGQTVNVSVNRSGGSTGATSVQLDVLNANAGPSDANLASTTLTWAAGDTQPKTAALSLTSDGLSEDLELLFVRLRNPQGGATISYPDTTAVTIGEVSAATRLRPLYAAPVIDESRGKAHVGVSRLGSAVGEARVSYRTLSGGSYGGATSSQGELVWPDGDTTAKLATIALNVATLSGGQSGQFQVELFNPINATLESASATGLTVLPVTLTVSDSASAPTPNPPTTPPTTPAGGGGGGGVVSMFILALLGSILAMRSTSRRRCYA
jgi:choice-of-anchor B domain-containing protein